MNSDTIVALIIAVVSSQALSSFISNHKSKHDIASQNIETAMALSSKLREDYSKLDAKHTELEKQYEQLKKNFDKLESENERLKKEIEVNKSHETKQ